MTTTQSDSLLDSDDDRRSPYGLSTRMPKIWEKITRIDDLKERYTTPRSLGRIKKMSETAWRRMEALQSRIEDTPARSTEDVLVHINAAIMQFEQVQGYLDHEELSADERNLVKEKMKIMHRLLRDAVKDLAEFCGVDLDDIYA